jgi:CPA1 family monovalent cation:H+ antiporter
MVHLLASHPALAIAAVIALGAGAQWLSWRLRVPAILPLLSIGFLVGPVLGWLRPSEVFGDALLYPAVSLAVGLVLFEGGLTLRLSELHETRRVIVSLITVGALVTWLGSAAAAYWLGALPGPLALLFGALVIVTGPTVIGPLLRIVRPTARVANVLKWEGIIIDVVGAMVAVLVSEALLLGTTQSAPAHTVVLLGRFLVVGAAAGAVAGYALAWLLKRRAMPDYLINVVSLATLFTAFTLANVVTDESGLLAAVVMGVVLANLRVPNIGALLSFKEDLSVLFVSMLFVVLAANLQLASLAAELTWRGLALLLVLVLVTRPAGVLLSSLRSPLTWPERLFLSGIAPRGIVAAAVSSLFASKLTAAGFEQARSLPPLVFLMIVGTVLLASLSARPLGVRLGVADPQGFLILGADEVARTVARALHAQHIPVLLADTNWSHVTTARVEGLQAYYGSLLSDRSDDELRLSGIGRLLALTSNDEANALTALKYAREFGTANVFQLAPGRGGNDRGRLGGERRARLLVGDDVTFPRMRALVHAGAEVKRTELTERFGMADYLQRYGSACVPLFVQQGKRIEVVAAGDAAPEPGSALFALVLESDDDSDAGAAESAGT